MDIPKNEIAFIRLLANETGSKGLLITIDTIHGKITLIEHLLANLLLKSMAQFVKLKLGKISQFS